jgi:hypothetical protein
LDGIFDSVLAKIDGLADDGLSTLMVVLDYLKRRIAPCSNGTALHGRSMTSSTPCGWYRGKTTNTPPEL